MLREQRRTDGRTDGPTDKAAYRVACTRLEIDWKRKIEKERSKGVSKVVDEKRNIEEILSHFYFNRFLIDKRIDWQTNGRVDASKNYGYITCDSDVYFWRLVQ